MFLKVLLCFSYLICGEAWVSQVPNFRSNSRDAKFFTSISVGALEQEEGCTQGQNQNINQKLENEKRDSVRSTTKLIHWRGEKSHGNSMQFRHLEFTSALESIINTQSSAGNGGQSSKEIGARISLGGIKTSFEPALSSNFTSADEMSEYQIYAYENAMQYVSIHSDQHEDEYYNDNDENPYTDSNMNLDNDVLIRTVERCALIRSIFEIVAEADTYPQLAQNAIDSRHFQDMMEGGSRANATWRVRLRQYGSSVDDSNSNKQKQYGKKMRSPMKQEREAINEMKELFLLLKGDVDLQNADESLYLFEGLCGGGRKALARLLARGANTSIIAPKTRICVTNTPLCPLAAYTMCNAARIQPGDRIFDPFAGSCAILLAAAMMEPTVQSVGVEIAHNGQVNRDHIVQDFTSRNLTPPTAIIRGDSMSNDVRDEARAAVGNQPFDVIVTDPPYGIREKTGFCPDPPLVNLVNCIARDRANNCRLLRKGGRLVAFVPNLEGDDIAMDMPSEDDLERAGLQFSQMLEQPLNDSLSRWLVEYICVK